MRYVFIDRIDECTPFESIRGVKAVSCQEPYLADHFEGFPVLPGVLMVQGALELASWLCRASKGFPRLDFRPLRVSRVRYLRMVRPGDILETEVTIVRWEGEVAEFKAKGRSGSEKVFTARLALQEEFCPSGRDETWDEWECAVLERQKTHFAALRGPSMAETFSAFNAVPHQET